MPLLVHKYSLKTGVRMRQFETEMPPQLIQRSQTAQNEKDNCGFGLIVNKKGYCSHRIVKTGVNALANMNHRGAVSADGISGDGCGILLKTDHDFYRALAYQNNIHCSQKFATSLVFLDPDDHNRAYQLDQIVQTCEKFNLETAGFIDLKTDHRYLGWQAKACCPYIMQVFINSHQLMTTEEFNEILYVVRCALENQFDDNPYFHFPSLSADTIIYKGLLKPQNLPSFYPDLANEKLTTDLCIFHQRFSTNTLPKWHLAQPFRHLAHNGEINTIKGNRNWVNANNTRLMSRLIGFKDFLSPITSDKVSDSSSLDHVAEVLSLNGMSLLKALRIMIPPAWQNQTYMDPDLRAFYEYYGMHMGAWDGPAGIVGTDGRYAICILDRNGLRPARWHENDLGDVTLASEAGVYDQNQTIVRKGRVGPGEMVAIDSVEGVFLGSEEISDWLKRQNPYKEWLNAGTKSIRRPVKDEKFGTIYAKEKLDTYLKMFNITFEEKEVVIKSLVENANEALGSMGDDTPIAVLSHKRRSLYEFFRQQFAQVTNPAIDPLRETTVMSLKTFIGDIGNILEPKESLANRTVLETPVLFRTTYDRLLRVNKRKKWIPLNYQADVSLKAALADIGNKVLKALDNGNYIIVLDDETIEKHCYPVHALLATGYVHQLLNAHERRCEANIIVKTGTARDSHHFACLLAFGATAIYPYLAYQLISSMTQNDELAVDWQLQARRNYRYGINKGLKKIMAKMGICTVSSYRGAQLFDILGLDQEVVDNCFTGSVNCISGFNFDDLYQMHLKTMHDAYDPHKTVEQIGRYKFNMHGEYHAFNPYVVMSLQNAVKTGSYKQYQVFADYVDNRGVHMLRDMLELQNASKPVDLDEVMSAEELFPYFDTAGMSLGALSPEAHEAMAAAMNRLGGKSNSGEGGEDKARYGNEKSSKIKQIASGRFGVTPHYLVNAEVIQIKIAQGAKPGEGGQLPGKKVNPMIAKLRFSVPGVTLISPPPHHDIYSIEDLAQLIFDLKQVNARAKVSVKLVSESGIGTIAAGVVKAYADMITVSGHDGGTGASPLSSIIYAGTPWEIGLSETHQVLVENDLRNKIVLQTDGGLKTGLDIIKAAMLGAESFGFGTAPMMALGCIYLRACHLNNCATGVATQNEVLRQNHFKGTVEKLMNYFRLVAEDVRHHLARLGVRHINEIIGRVDLLKPQPESDARGQQALDLSQVLYDTQAPRHKQIYRQMLNRPEDKADLAHQLLDECRPYIEKNQPAHFNHLIYNTDRTIGALVSGHIATVYGDKGLDQPLNLNFVGSAGQSFAAFNSKNMYMHLEGEANDYVGKGMAGGEIVVIPPPDAQFTPHLSPIMGNTCLYGATGGTMYAYGVAGERFAVRNSGAVAVIEGAGDHCCEYMTGGIVVALGEVGINFGAGMTGGMAFVLDESQNFINYYNNEFIKLYRLQSERMQDYQDMLYNLIKQYLDKTQSIKAQRILTHFEDYLCYFWLVSTETLEDTDMLSSVRPSINARSVS